MRSAAALTWLVATTALSAEPLHVYTSIDAQEAADLFAAFREDTGIDVRAVRLSAGEAITRLRAERGRPQASVWFGGPSLDYLVAANDGLLSPYEPKALSDYPDGARDPQWRWVGAYLGLIGFVSHPARLAEKGAKPPTSWAELEAASLHGEVSLAYPYTSGTAYLVLASLVSLHGETEALSRLGKVDGNVHHYNRSGAACVTQVALREVGTCVAFSQDILAKGLRRGYPLTLTFPSEGTAFEVGGLALVAGGPERAAGEKLVEWLLSAPTQARLAAKGRIPIRPGVAAPDGLPTLAQVKLVNVDVARAARDRKRLIEAWRASTGQ